MVSFAKLKPSQQLLKRYEMLNKHIVAPAAPISTDSKLKRPQQQATASSTDKKDKAVPHLIMDGSSVAPKVPLIKRQRCLSLIFENGKTLFATLEKACEKAAEQEKSIYDRSKNKDIYTNLAANLIKSLRDQQLQQQQVTLSNKPLVNTSTKLVNQSCTKQVTTFSHEALLSGPKATRVSYSINRVKQIEVKDLTSILSN